jgi:hypothetical protein
MLCAIGFVLVFAGLRHAGATQAVAMTPRADQVRFQLIGNEPVAGPDDYSLVKGWSVLMFKDRKADQCYLVFSRRDGISAANAVECPPPR